MRTVFYQLQRVKMPPISSKPRKLLFFRLTLSFYFFFCSLMFANWNQIERNNGLKSEFRRENARKMIQALEI